MLWVDINLESNKIGLMLKMEPIPYVISRSPLTIWQNLSFVKDTVNTVWYK